MSKFNVGDKVKANGIVVELTVFAEEIDRWAGVFLHRGGENHVSGHISQTTLEPVEQEATTETSASFSAGQHPETNQPELPLGSADAATEGPVVSADAESNRPLEDKDEKK